MANEVLERDTAKSAAALSSNIRKKMEDLNPI
jgi:hypothetical protein